MRIYKANMKIPGKSDLSLESCDEMTKKIVAIHQPNFFPWLGFFDKIVKSDIFIFLNNVQAPKTGGSWLNHVKIIVAREPRWVTMTLIRNYHGCLRIDELSIDNATPWRKRLLKTIQANYSRAEYFEEIFPFISTIVSNNIDSVSEFNINCILRICQEINIDTSGCVLGSTLDTGGKGTDRLIQLTKIVEATTYLCGGGSAGYLEEGKFDQEGIKLVYQSFDHPIYPQRNTSFFVPGLSIIDPLMNVGFDGVHDLLVRP